MNFFDNMLIVRCDKCSHRTIVFLHCFDGLLDESDFIGSEGILAIELLVDAFYVLLPNCWRLLMKVLTLTAPSIGDSSNTMK